MQLKGLISGVAKNDYYANNYEAENYSLILTYINSAFQSWYLSINTFD